MIIYIDDDYKCHVSDDGTMRSVDTAFFDGKCPEFIEGYRFVPQGETWVREDGVAFTGEMVSPWLPSEELEKAQADWEHEQLEAARAELEKADNQKMELLDIIENLILEG